MNSTNIIILFVFSNRLLSMDILKQLAPLYRKDEELSLAGMDDSEFLPSSRVLYLCICK